MDKTFQIILRQMAETGQAPHYKDIAAKLGLAPDEDRDTSELVIFQKLGKKGEMDPEFGI